MPNVELNSKEDVEDFVRGVTFYGTGGGGNPKRGLETLLKDLENKKRIFWVDHEEIDEAFLCASVFFMGSAAPENIEDIKKRELIGLQKKIIENPLINAIEEIESYIGEKIDVIVPIELGGGNTPRPFDVAISLNKIFVDGDYAGRAIPEIVQTLPSILGKKLTPMVAVDFYGNVSIIKDTINNLMAERLGKMLSVASYSNVAEAGFIWKVKEMKNYLINGTLSQSLEVGRAIRIAREKGKDPVNAAIEKANGYLLFEGVLVDKKWEDRDGYMWGTHIFKGENKFKGRTFKIWFKNENHISWLDEEIYVTSPDLIQVLRRKDGEPLTNGELQIGENVAIVGMKTKEIFRTQESLIFLGPSHFGFDHKYVPIEKLIEE